MLENKQLIKPWFLLIKKKKASSYTIQERKKECTRSKVKVESLKNERYIKKYYGCYNKIDVLEERILLRKIQQIRNDS